MEDQWEELEWKAIFACPRCGYAREFICINPEVKDYPLGCLEDDEPISLIRKKDGRCPECGRLISKTDYYFQPASVPFKHPLMIRVNPEGAN